MPEQGIPIQHIKKLLNHPGMGIIQIYAKALVKTNRQ